MKIAFYNGGLYVTFRHATLMKRALGFVIKPACEMLFSEREGRYRRSLRVGPIYARTFAKIDPADFYAAPDASQ